MTLASERLNALRNARLFLTSLLYRDATPRVPMAIREQARSVLKHFPWTCDQETIEKKCACGVFKDGTHKRSLGAKSKLKKNER